MSRNMLVKDFEHIRARELYLEGRTYNEIVTELGVAKSSVSLWCRDLAQERLKAKMALTKQKKTKVKCALKIKAVKRVAERVGKPASAPYVGFTYYEYNREDGIISVQLINRVANIKLSMTRARYNMSCHLDRILLPEELVRRLSDDLHDDRIENLKIMIKNEPRVHVTPMRECQTCASTFAPTRQLRKYCSEVCQVKPKVAKIVVPRKPQVRKIKQISATDCVICETVFYAREGVETCSKKCLSTLLHLQQFELEDA